MKKRDATVIEHKNFPHERDLYGVRGAVLRHCTFEGEEDGESALKEAADIALSDCRMELRYPLWHDRRVRLERVTMTPSCRAALWYSHDVEIIDSDLGGIKALRECTHADIRDSRIVSPEFGWRSRHVSITGGSLESEYAFLQATDVSLDGVAFGGKYAFQYVKRLSVRGCRLNTKDAFWHTKDVTVRDSVVKGEYLGWYSENLTFVNCTIVGTQPLCYCKNLTLVDCRMEETDLSFEYSDVQATVLGSVLSVKNPRSGRIVADDYGEILRTADSKFPCACEILRR